jgi:methyl-accepting chemotaxis protein
MFSFFNKYFNNAKMIFKVTVAPVVIAALLLIAIVTSLFFLYDQRQVIGELYNIRIAHLNRVEQINNDLMSLNMNLYRLASLANLNYPADKIEELSKELRSSLSAQANNFQLFINEKDLLPEEKSLLAAASSNFELYFNDARIIIDTVRTDPGIASRTIINAEDLYYQLHNNLAALEKVEDFAGKTSYSKINSHLWISMVFFIIIILISAIIISIIVRSITSWFGNVIDQFGLVSKRVETGDLNITLDIKSKDELGKLTQLFNSILKRLNESYGIIREMSGKIDIKSKDLTSKSSLLSASSEKQALQSRAVFENMGKYLKALEENSSSIEKQLITISDAASAIGELNNGVQNMIRSIDDLKKNIIENSKIAAINRENFAAFEKNIATIGEFFNDLSNSIKRFEEYSENIDQILRVISDISEQTSMLAMNAAIEAAHAGTAGEGFAIVASEVRKLSESTAKSVTEIGAFISSIKSGIRESTEKLVSGSANTRSIAESARESGKSLEKLINSIETVNNMAANISAVTQDQGISASKIQGHSESLKTFSIDLNNAMKEQGEGAKKIIETISQVSSSIEDNVKAIEELADLSLTLKNDSRQLAESVRFSAS